VKCYVFRASRGTGQAVTDDKTGAKLPKRSVGTWVYDRDVDIEPSDEPRFGSNSQDIVNGIQQDGYFIWPQRSRYR
jgi:hypothetical protein